MTIAKSRFALLGVAVAALAAAGAVPAANAAGLTPAVVPTPSQVLDGPACPAVMVIAARGTNELPSNSNWQTASAYTGDQYHGAGQTLYTMYGELETDNPNVTLSLDPVVYPTAAPQGTGLTLAQNTAQYLGDASNGAKNISDVIQATDDFCGKTVRYILAGYSLGAWAVHDALNKLSPTQLSEIAGVTLFGDPKFQPNASGFKAKRLRTGPVPGCTV